MRKETCGRCDTVLTDEDRDQNVEMKDSVLYVFGDYMPVCTGCAKSFRRLFSAWLDKKTPEYTDINPDNFSPWHRAHPED